MNEAEYHLKNYGYRGGYRDFDSRFQQTANVRVELTIFELGSKQIEREK